MSIYETQLRGRSIRLLNLLPGQDSDPLCCDLLHTSLDSPQAYKALSYVWGNASITETITCCGQPRQATVNLAAALRKLRRHEGPRVLWVDALCINQEDISERNHQVQLMGDVYAEAACVIAWLGEDDDEVCRLIAISLNVLKSILVSDSMYRLRPNHSRLNAYDLPVARVCDAISQHSNVGDPTSAFNSLFEKPYWQRIWCVQELIKAKAIKIRLDTTEVAGEMLANFLAWYYSQTMTWRPSPISLYGMGNALNMLNITVISDDMWYNYAHLLDILHNFRHFQATDRRDHVYGILGLLHSSELKYPIQVDYSKTLGEVYADVVWASIQTTRSLAFLAHVDHDTSYAANGEIPSWAPQWHIAHEKDKYNMPKGSSASRSRPLGLFPRKPCGSNTLTLSGLSFDYVIEASNDVKCGLAGFEADHDCKDLLLRLASRIEDQESRDGDAASRHPRDRRPAAIALAATLTGGVISWDTPTKNRRFLHRQGVHENEAAQFVADFWTFTHAQRSSEPAPQHTSLWRAMCFWCDKRRFFQTSKGYVGTGPACMQAGDRIVVLDGGDCPYVLRLLDEDRREYTYMGECYIYDIMEGETVQMLGQHGVQETEFVLR